MSDLLIQGVEKPSDCGKCFVSDRTLCTNGCIISDLSEHGDLVDLDERVTKQIYDDYNAEWYMKTKTVRQWLNVDEKESIHIVVPSNKEVER